MDKIDIIVIGAGVARRASAVRWGVARNVVTAWVITIPCSAAVAAYGGGGISFGAITPNETIRYGFSAFVTWPHVIGWGVDTGSGITFNATQSSSKAGAVVPILPA